MNTLQNFSLLKWIVLFYTFLLLPQIGTAQTCGFGDPICIISTDYEIIEGCSPDDAPSNLFTEIEDVFGNLPSNPCGILTMISLPPFIVEGGTGCVSDPYKVVHVYCLFDDLDENGTFEEGEPFIFGFQFFKVVDTTAPALACPPDQVLTCFEGIPSPATTIAEFIAIGGSVFDACTALEDLTILHTQTDNNGSNCPGDAREHIRTYIVTDACGNQSSCEQVFTYLESFDGPAIIDILPACYKFCGELANPEISDVVYTSDCSFGATVDITGPEIIGLPNCPDTKYRYSYVVTDDCGRSSFPVTRDFIVGNDGPTIECPSYSLILECGDPNNQAYIDTHLLDVSANTSCALDYNIYHFPQNIYLLDCGSSTVVTFIVTDACGRTASCTTTIAIQDNTAPTITGIPPSVCDVTECGGDVDFWFNHWINYMFDGLVAVDDCDSNVAWTTSTTPVLNTDCNADGEAATIVTFVASDNCGNTTTVSGTFVIQNEYPAAFQNVPADETISCTETPVFGPDPDIVNTCQTTLTFIDMTNNNDPCAITMTRTWIATDECGGLTTSTMKTISIIDDQVPEFTFVPSNETIACDADPVFGTAVATDLCTSVTLTQEDSNAGDDCNGSYTRTWTATDDCGNTATASQTISYEDNESPVFTFIPANETIACNATPDFGTPLTSDNCNTVSLSQSDSDSGDDCNGSYTRTWTATDDCGNTATASQTISYEDNESPVFTFIPANETIACNATPDFGTPLTSDNCNTVSLSQSDSDSGDDCNGSYTRTWTATDDCGNTATASQTISYEDNESPVFTFTPANEIIACNATPDFGTPLTSDNCNTVSLSQSDSDSGDDCNGSYTRTWTATDDCGNTATASQTISYEDNESPVFTFTPANEIIACNATPDFGTPLTSDNCNTVSLSQSDSDSGDDCSGTYTRTWTATDACGNTATASQTISYEDNESPVFTFTPANETIACNATPDFGTPLTSDNCNTVSLLQSDSNSGNDCSGTYTRTWTATDACGNTAIASQTISYSDTEAPVFSFVPGNSNQECGGPFIFGDPTAIDDCNVAIITHADVASGGNCSGGTLVRTWTATDTCGNSATASATIFLFDGTPPVASNIPADKAQSCDEILDFGPIPDFTDNCDSAVFISHTDFTTPGDCPNEFTVQRVWTGIDDCGNSVSASQTINVFDITPPVFTLVPAGGDFECGTGTPVFDLAEATDNCSGAFISFDDETSGSGCNISVTRTWTATDACGNSTTASSTISYHDDEAPSFTFVPGVLDVDCDENQDFIPPVAEDNCSTVLLTFIDLGINGDVCDDGFAKSRLWTATDDCGNTSTVETTVWVNPDEEGPEWTFVPETADVDCNENQDFVFPEATDNCGSVVITWEEDINGTLCHNGFAKVRTWTATDDCGNASTVETIVWVNPDEAAPVFVNVPSGGTIECSSYPPALEEPLAEDLCGGVTLSVEEMFVGNPQGCQVGEDFELHRIWTATDDCGNTATASQVYLVLGATTAPGANVMGEIYTEEAEGIAGVSVSLDGTQLGLSDLYETTEDGQYQFYNLPLDQNYTITPYLDNNPLNGISSFDMVLINKHLLEIQSLDSPYKLIAADINRSGSITTLDLLDLRRLILHVDTTFQNNSSWRFVEADFVFPEPTNPFATIFPESTNINGLSENKQYDYVGVKVGDVNATAHTNGLLSGDGRDFTGDLIFSVKDKKLEAGESYEVTFKTSDFTEIAGYQYTLRFDPDKVEVRDIVPGNIAGMGIENYGLQLLENGYLTTSWTQARELSLVDGAELFTLQLTAQEEIYLSELFTISSKYTSAEAYRKQANSPDLALNDIRLHFEEADAIANLYVLYQNEPNPFHDQTSIGFQLPEECEASLTIYDLTGKVLQQKTGLYNRGFHQVIFEKEDLGATGILYYQLLTPKWRSTKKMTLIKW